MTQDVICAASLTEEGQEEALSIFFRLLRPHREQLYAYYRGKQSVPKGETVPSPSPLSGTPPEHPAAVHDADLSDENFSENTSGMALQLRPRVKRVT